MQEKLYSHKNANRTRDVFYAAQDEEGERVKAQLDSLSQRYEAEKDRVDQTIKEQDEQITDTKK